MRVERKFDSVTFEVTLSKEEVEHLESDRDWLWSFDPFSRALLIDLLDKLLGHPDD